MTSKNQKWHSLGDFLKAKEDREKESVEKPLPESQSPATLGTLGSEGTQSTQGSESTHSTLTTQSTHSTLTTQGSQGGAPSEVPVAPTRDFMKVANSISRNAVPSGIFTGKSKQIYDYLYSRTRGAIQPSRSIQLRRREIMEGAHVGSDKTLRENLIRLRSAGLVAWTGDIGTHGGNVYTVYLPEEVQSTPATQGTLGTQGTMGSSSHFLPTVPRVESTEGSEGLIVENTSAYASPKTYIKTNTIDDDEAEAFAGLIARLKECAREITGKYPTTNESARWEEVGDVLAVELKIAAARTTVSSIPSFLAEHLRRRLWKVDKKEARAKGRELPDETVKPNSSDPITNCPDCGGTGWWYPEGFERGVKKCGHEKLSNKSNPEA